MRPYQRDERMEELRAQLPSDHRREHQEVGRILRGPEAAQEEGGRGGVRGQGQEGRQLQDQAAQEGHGGAASGGGGR